MKYTKGSVGQILVMRLEDGDPIYASIENAAQAEGITHAMAWIIGGMKNGQVVVGPQDSGLGATVPFQTLVQSFTDAREVLGVGMIFPSSDGSARLHMHAGIGKGATPLVGCPRLGADCWLVNEVVIMELCGVEARRLQDQQTGFELLHVGK
jgi:predicted DNA-binding protein with PD1-like motif